MEATSIRDSLDLFTKSYIGTALWSTNDDNGVPLDEHYDREDLSWITICSMIADCVKFQRENKTDIDGEDEQAGHDFWLTRNGHGAGFWDGDWPEPAATRLTDASEAFGEFGLYIGDDKQIYSF